jgi:hypothetical protein
VWHKVKVRSTMDMLAIGIVGDPAEPTTLVLAAPALGDDLPQRARPPGCREPLRAASPRSSPSPAQSARGARPGAPAIPSRSRGSLHWTWRSAPSRYRQRRHSPLSPAWVIAAPRAVPVQLGCRWSTATQGHLSPACDRQRATAAVIRPHGILTVGIPTSIADTQPVPPREIGPIARALEDAINPGG